MTAGDAFAYMNDEGALRIGTEDFVWIYEVIKKENTRAQDILEHLVRAGRMSMRMSAKWADRLELEDFVRYLLEKGAIQFGEACDYYRARHEPEDYDLISFLAERREKSADEAWLASLYQHLHDFRAAEAAATKKAVPPNVGAPIRDGRSRANERRGAGAPAGTALERPGNRTAEKDPK